MRSFWVRPSCSAWAAGAAGPRRSFCGLAVARPRVVPGSFPPASACFSWPRRCFGLPQRFSWLRRGFPLPAIKKARQPFVIRERQRELEIIAKPLGLLHEALLSGRSFLRAETRSYSLPLQRIACRLPICLVCRSPIFVVRRLLRRSRCVLSCAGVEADSW